MVSATFDPTAIKAIPTTYNNLTFRSRLEARWAVVMDALSVRYDYEPEGYECAGVRYLCDFYLPDLKCWVEIKPTPEAVDSHARRKIAMLCEGLCQPVFVFAGACAPPVYSDDEDDVQNAAFGFFPGKPNPETRRYAFGRCVRCQRVGFCWNPDLACGCNENQILEATRSIWMHTAFSIAKTLKFDRMNLVAQDVRFMATTVWTETLNYLGDSDGYPTGRFVQKYIDDMNRSVTEV